MSRLSKLANETITSPILTFAASVNAKIAAGEHIYNLTVGDFNPDIYQIPDGLKTEIINAYKDNETNYPGAVGLTPLRMAISSLIQHYTSVEIDINNILIASGSRPLIYATYKTLVDEGDTVVFPVPSWNNEHYAQLTGANAITIETSAEHNFMPTRDELLPHIQDARLIALCSPQNPTGTVLSKQQLSDICELVVAENKRRGSDTKPLYVMFDQVYWLMAFDEGTFHHGLHINPEIEPYAVFIDGMSKAFAATGLRVGWATGPNDVIAKMRAFVAHIGAWAPKAEQVATGTYLANIPAVNDYITGFRARLERVLGSLYQGVMQMKASGLPVDSISPEASIYLSLQIDIIGKTTADGTVLSTVDDVQEFLLNQAHIAVLPFSWFGAQNADSWYRISIGVCPEDATDTIISRLTEALASLRE